MRTLSRDASQRVICVGSPLSNVFKRDRVQSPPRSPTSMDNVFSAGDIIVCRSNGRMAQIGAMGGHFGHVMLVTSNSTCVESGTLAAFELEGVWPKHETQIWTVPVIESTRGVEGLHETTLLVYHDRASGTIKVVADLSSDDELSQCDGDVVEVWQRPTTLRDLLSSSACGAALMAETIPEMKKILSQSSWSEMTAVRAALMPAALDSNIEGAQALAQVKTSWSVEPICTSVAIIFWQLMLCKLASRMHVNSDPDLAISLIKRWMPVRADRSLPGDLCEALFNSGWIKTARPNHMRVKL